MSKAKAFSKPDMPLTPPIFYILLVLAVKERHGYDIMKQVESESKGKIKLGPGTLYTAIKRLLEAGLIKEANQIAENSKDDERRKYYTLTETGRKILSTELQRFFEALILAKKHNLLPNTAIPNLVPTLAYAK
jgi:DNA-binding PadR family transcriptional regulator